MTPPNDTHELQEELKRLSQQQSVALQIAAYINMDPTTAHEYDERADRISEIIKLIKI
jgi:hypothetical protein